jgi:hypothetical protein
MLNHIIALLGIARVSHASPLLVLVVDPLQQYAGSLCRRQMRIDAS